MREAGVAKATAPQVDENLWAVRDLVLGKSRTFRPLVRPLHKLHETLGATTASVRLVKGRVFASIISCQ